MSFKIETDPKMMELNDQHKPNHLQGAAFDIVAIAASAGGLTAIRKVLSGLPIDFPAAVLVVQHLDPRHSSLMADIPSCRTQLHVKSTEEGDVVRSSTVFIAPPNRHLLVNSDGT